MTERQKMLKYRKEHDVWNADKTILLQIAAYCDPELMNTVYSALIQAEFPDRVHFAICLQDDDLTDYYKLKGLKHCKISYLTTKEARGLCYARNICQKLLDDEDFVMHTDSHMRFVKHWDTKIIQQWESMNDPKAVISAYPPSCTEEMMVAKLDSSMFDEPGPGRYMYANQFGNCDSTFIRFNCRGIDNNHERVGKRNVFISGGSFFGPAQVDRDVLNDPNMFFVGDELPMAIRLFTWGYNLYNPGESYVYHKYCRENRKFPKVPTVKDSEDIRFRYITGVLNEDIDMGEYGYGSERTFEEFEEYAGIDFKNHILYESAVRGIFDNEEYKHVLCDDQKEISEQFKKVRTSKIEVSIMDFTGDVDEIHQCMMSAYNNATNPDRVYIKVVTMTGSVMKKLMKKLPKGLKSKIKVLYSPNRLVYGEMFKKAAKALHENVVYMCVCDSATRFIKTWDTQYIETNVASGDRSFIGSWQYTMGSKDKSIVAYVNQRPVLKNMNWPYAELVLKNFDTKDVQVVNAKFFDGCFVFGYVKNFEDLFAEMDAIPASYDAYKIILPLILYTNGYDISYGTTSYIVRVQSTEYLNKDKLVSQDTTILRKLTGVIADDVRFEHFDFHTGNAKSVVKWREEYGIDYENRVFRAG